MGAGADVSTRSRNSARATLAPALLGRARMLRPWCFSILIIAAVAAAVACGGLAADAAAAGGTPAPDGSNGYCCPAKTGGCALSGGYRTEGDCPKDWDLCDNMCEQRIVKDEHGCDKLTYKVPPVTTTFASEGSCSGPAFNGGWRDAGADAKADADAGGGANADAEADGG
jgi:hypothetical protein